MSEGAPRRVVGLVVPAANPSLDRLLADTPVAAVLGIDVAVSRTPVGRIGSDGESDGQFTAERLAAAVRVFAADVGLVVWVGTAGFWEAGERTVLDGVAELTGKQVTSAREAIFAALEEASATRTALITPYPADIHAAVTAALERAGIEVVGSHGFELTRPSDIAKVITSAIATRALILSGRDNLPVSVIGAGFLGIVSGPPVFDTLVATLWHAARTVGATSAGYLQTYASLFDVPLASMSEDPRTDAFPALETLRLLVGADRATVRLDVPGMDFPCVAESYGDGVLPISLDNSLDQAGAATAQWIERTHRVLVQPDVRTATPAPPQALVDTYGVRAQMLAPIIVEGERVGWVSLHSAEPKTWTRSDIFAIERAAIEFAGRHAQLVRGAGYTRWIT